MSPQIKTLDHILVLLGVIVVLPLKSLHLMQTNANKSKDQCIGSIRKAKQSENRKEKYYQSPDFLILCENHEENSTFLVIMIYLD